MYRHFAENLYSRTQATPIDHGIIELLDQRHVNDLLAAEPDEHELWKVLKNRKCGSAPGGDGKRHETKLHTDQVFLTGLRSRK